MPYWGKIRLPRRQPRHQLLAGRDAVAARLVSAVAPADHARPASGADAALHLQRPGAAEPESRSDPLRRAAGDGELRDVADGEVRHARRLDARLRRHVVARLSRVHVVEPQRHDPDVRDPGIQRREHAEDAARQSERHRRERRRRPGAGRWRQRRGRPGADAAAAAARPRQPGHARLVPAVAGDRRVRLVAPQQHELRRDRRAHGAAVHVAVPEDHPRELLRQVAQLDGDRPEGNRRRLRDSRRASAT